VLFVTVYIFGKEPLFSISSCFSGSNGRIFLKLKTTTLVTNVIREEEASWTLDGITIVRQVIAETSGKEVTV
jgi:hypothetical protein